MSTISEIHLFDFDATLFRSPEPPEWWSGSYWWRDVRSLDVPCVPGSPGDDWWIRSTVGEARRSISDPKVYTVLATGRPDSPFRSRVPELLKQKGLGFDEIHLKTGADTFAFKAKFLRKALQRHPEVRRIRVWDDRGDHLKRFSDMFGDAIEVDVTPVRVKPKEPVCTMESIQRVASRWLAGCGSRH